MQGREIIKDPEVLDALKELVMDLLLDLGLVEEDEDTEEEISTIAL